MNWLKANKIFCTKVMLTSSIANFSSVSYFFPLASSNLVLMAKEHAIFKETEENKNPNRLKGGVFLKLGIPLKV